MLAMMGGTVVMACRDLQKAEVAAAEIRRSLDSSGSLNTRLEVQHLDLSDLASVRGFVKQFGSVHPEVCLPWTDTVLLSHDLTLYSFWMH